MVAIGSSLACTLALGRGESCGRCSSSFFDVTRMVVLVAGQGRATSESLLAVGIGALVRASPRMYPSVASQRAAITERLQRGQYEDLRGDTWFHDQPWRTFHSGEAFHPCELAGGP